MPERACRVRAGVQVSVISVSGPHVAAPRAGAGERACQHNDLDHQRDAGACDGDNQQRPHRG